MPKKNVHDRSVAAMLQPEGVCFKNALLSNLIEASLEALDSRECPKKPLTSPVVLCRSPGCHFDNSPPCLRTDTARRRQLRPRAPGWQLVPLGMIIFRDLCAISGHEYLNSCKCKLPEMVLPHQSPKDLQRDLGSKARNYIITMLSCIAVDSVVMFQLSDFYCMFEVHKSFQNK